MGRLLNARSFEFLGLDTKVWLALETTSLYGVDSGDILPTSAGSVDFNTTDIVFDIPREDSPSRSGRSVTSRLSGKKTVEVSMESQIIPGVPDGLGNPVLPPMHPALLVAFGSVDTADPTKIIYKLTRNSENSFRVLEEATHFARLAVGVIADNLTFTLPGDGKATMNWEGFAQDAFLAGESLLVQALTGAEQLATVIIQDLTYDGKVASGINGNLISVIYTAGATAGAEVVTVVGNAISVQIEDGVSTATEVKDAVDAFGAAAALVDVTISGTAGDPQDIFSPAVFLTGGLGTNDFKVTAGCGVLYEAGAFVDIIQGVDGDTNIVSARKVTAVNGTAVPTQAGGPNADIVTVDGAALPVAIIGDIAIGHAPEDYTPRTSEFALLGLKGSFTVAGLSLSDCELLSAEISITNNFTKKDFIYGTSRICGFVPDKRREVGLNFELLLDKNNLRFYMRNKCFVAEDITLTLEPQDICGPAVADGTGQIFEWKIPKAEFNIPPIEQPSDAFVTLSLEGIALAPSANQLDEEMTLTIR